MGWMIWGYGLDDTGLWVGWYRVMGWMIRDYGLDDMELWVGWYRVMGWVIRVMGWMIRGYGLDDTGLWVGWYGVMGWMLWGYGLDNMGFIPARGQRFLCSLKCPDGFWTQACCSVDIWDHFWVWSGRDMKLTHLVLILRMCGAIPPLSQYALWHAQALLSSLDVQHRSLHWSLNAELRVVTFMRDFMGSVECRVFFFLNPILKLKMHGAVSPLPIPLYIRILIKHHLPYTLLLSVFVGTDLHQQIAHCHHM